MLGGSVVYKLVQTQFQLNEMAACLSEDNIVAFDVECANGLHHYVNRVCLLQLAGRAESFVVDALAGLDLSPVGRIIEDPAIEIVMHDTDFDLRSLDRDFGWHPRNLFDTLIAARLCGHREFGLAKLLENLFEIKRSKKFQRADWTLRPIPTDMIEYAASDVDDLIRLRDVLHGRLEELDRMDWARAEFAQCEEKRFVPDERPLFARVKKARELCNGRALAILQELATLRDNVARQLDLPLFMVMRDDAMIELANRPPLTVEDLSERRGIHPSFRRQYALDLIDAVKRGQNARALSWPRSESWGRYSYDLLDALKSWRAAYGNQLGVDGDIVVSMSTLKRIARGDSLDEALSCEPIMKWRGEEILASIKPILSSHRP